MTIWSKWKAGAGGYGWRPYGVVMTCDQCRKVVDMRWARNGAEIECLYSTDGAHPHVIDGRDLCGDCMGAVAATLPPRAPEAEEPPQ